jgi:hypothetical protein
LTRRGILEGRQLQGDHPTPSSTAPTNPMVNDDRYPRCGRNLWRGKSFGDASMLCSAAPSPRIAPTPGKSKPVDSVRWLVLADQSSCQWRRDANFPKSRTMPEQSTECYSGRTILRAPRISTPLEMVVTTVSAATDNPSPQISRTRTLKRAATAIPWGEHCDGRLNLMRLMGEVQYGPISANAPLA